VARRPRPVKSAPVEQPTTIHRLARVATDWKAIVTAILLAFGGVAYALRVQFATKDELATVSAHVTAHDVEFAGFKQALDDIRETVHQIHDDQHQLNFSHR